MCFSLTIGVIASVCWLVRDQIGDADSRRPCHARVVLPRYLWRFFLRCLISQNLAVHMPKRFCYPRAVVWEHLPFCVVLRLGPISLCLGVEQAD